MSGGGGGDDDGAQADELFSCTSRQLKQLT